MLQGFKGFKLKVFTPKDAYLYPVDGLYGGKVGIETHIIRKIVEQRSDILVIVKGTNECMRLSALDLELDGEEGSSTFTAFNGKSYSYKYYTFKAETHNVDEWELKLLQRFHHSWFNALRPTLSSDEFKNVIKTVNAERKTTPVYPDIQDVFKVFSLNINTYRCVILGNEPYHIGNHANGLAFGTKQEQAPKSLAHIHKSIGSPEKFDITMEEWFKKSVLLLNTTLTVPHNMQGKHKELWRPFIKKVIEAFDEATPNAVWTVLGDEAEKFVDLIDADALVLYAEHPATAVAEKREWVHNDCIRRMFRETNIRFSHQINLI